MKQNLHIRQLIDRYYDGATTPTEFDEIVRYFATAPDVDADLEPDKAVFLALGGAVSAPDEVPDSLRRSLESIGKESRGRFSAVVHRVLPYAAAAAVVACVVAVALGLFRSSDAPDDPTAPMAEAVVESDTLSPVAAECVSVETVQSSAAEVAEAQAAPVRKPAPVVKKKRVRKAGGNATPTERERRGAHRTVELLNRSLSKVNLACSDVEKSFQEIDNTLNSLQE